VTLEDYSFHEKADRCQEQNVSNLVFGARFRSDHREAIEVLTGENRTCHSLLIVNVLASRAGPVKAERSEP
jgi:hypothetical protein